VAQKGSLVSADRLRFDFSHQKPMEPDEIAAVADIANRVVIQDSAVETRLMAVEDAMETGAMALFGEKYGDEVRVVAMGTPDETSGSKSAWSIELCGGTHVERTGEIGLIHLTSESASAAGVRRIEALTGDGARAFLAAQDQRMRDLAAALKTKPDEVVARVGTLVEERRALERQVAELKKQIALGAGAGESGGEIETIGNVKYLARRVEGLNPKDLRGLVDNGKQQVGSGIVAIVGITEDGKAGLAIGVTDDLTDTYSAVDLVRIGAVAVGGKGGGGRPDMAQAGGPDGAKADDAIAAVRAELANA
jgi:alanyl-tRNA synthetase